jgi:hypothetical protein
MRVRRLYVGAKPEKLQRRGESRTTKSNHGKRGPGLLRTLVSLYSSPSTLAINVFFFVGYYVLFYEVIVRSNSGLFILTIPFPLLVAFVLASSLLATVAVEYLRISLRRRGVPGVAGSPLSVAVGAFVASCSCNLPLLAPLLYFIGLNSLEVSGVISFLAAYQQTIVEALILLDIASLYYYLKQISRAGPMGEKVRRSVNNTVSPAS